MGCSCHKVWYRQGDELTDVGIGQIHGTTDAIQPGTAGTWKGTVTFTVTGRLRVWFESTAYNYWTLDCNDGLLRYLGEGYGMYEIYEALPENPAVNSRKFLIEPPANQLTLLGEGNFAISARHDGKVIELEGNVSVPVFPAFFKTIGASSETRHIEIIGYAQDYAIAYEVHVVSGDSLWLENTRTEAPNGRKFDCPHCSTETWVTTYPYAQSWVCRGCDTRYSLENGGRERLEHGHNEMGEPMLPIKIGEDITIHGVRYTVIGVSFKQDKYSRDDTWSEYTLYERLQGFAFLVESQGHWTIVREIKAATTPLRTHDTHLRIGGDLYERFTQYSYKILYADGEFPGDAFNEHQFVDVVDYIAPPKMLSFEKDTRHNLTWFAGESVRADEIADQTHRHLPSQRGVGPTQVKINVSTDSLVMSAVIAILLVLAVQLLTGGFRSSRELLDNNYHFADSVTTGVFVTPKFELEKRKSSIELYIYAPVDNSWFELNATLVNAEDGTEYVIDQAVEFYHGYDEGTWTEGSTQEHAYLTGIPKGTYFFQFTGSRAYSSAPNFRVVATYDVPIYRNVLIIMLLVAIVPIAIGIADYNYEQQRWVNSPFTNSSQNRS